ncbi:MAG TPA: substrate-binding domain-containing protein [Planctomycetota bacterium]|nr:substrate-binding domain-containing protein [Planctomycetota bacterium]HRR78797.1 substrate-binding domain-containing protein [Planctomycetota bacterium]HRT94940.1 substrate-binding domain-containing protein [Planctomycetota bacterium]
MVRRLLAAATMSSLLLALLGCGEEGQPAGKGAEAKKGAKKLTFAVIPKAQVFTFWPTVERGAQAAGKELGVEIIWQGATDETKYIEQQQIVKTMISRKVDGIVLAPTSKTALVDVVKQAVDAKIPVSIIDSAIDTDVYVSFVATDNYAGGVTGARRLAEILGKKGKVALIKVIPGSASTTAREEGFRETLKKEFPDMQLVAEEYGMSQSTKSLEVTSNILTANPDLDGIFAANEPGAIGALNAVKNKNLVGKVKIVGFDASPILLAGIRDGSLDSTIVQDPFSMGYQGVKAIVDHLAGKKVEKEVHTRVALVTKDNLESKEVQDLLSAYEEQKPR